MYNNNTLKDIEFRDCISKQNSSPHNVQGLSARFETVTPLPSGCGLEPMSSGLQSPFTFRLSIEEELVSKSKKEAYEITTLY